MQFLPLILTIGLFIASLRQPAIALVSVLLMFPLGMALQATIPVFATNTWLFNVLFAAMAAVAMARVALSRHESLTANLFTPSLVAIWGLYAWACITMAWSPDSEAPIKALYTGLPYWILLLVAAPMLIHRVEQLDRLIPALLIVGILISASIMLNPNVDFYSGRIGLQLGHRERTNPLVLGTLGGLMVVIATLTIFQRRSLWHWGVCLAGFVSGAGIALLSGSRGNLIFSIVASLVFAPIAYRVKNIKGFALTVLALLILLAGLYFAAGRFISSENIQRWDPTDLAYSGEGRFENVADLLGEYLSRPEMWVQGLGLSAFRVLNTRSGDPYSHVMLADAIGETGLIGLTLLFVVAIIAWRSGRRLVAMLDEAPTTRSNAVVLLALCFYYFLLANKQGSFLGTSALFALLIIAARVESELRERFTMAGLEAHDELETDELVSQAAVPR
jgi:hypothetical protein